MDVNGVHVIRGESGNSEIEGTVRFRWIFLAAEDNTYVPPDTGITVTRVLMAISVLLAVAVVVFMVLIMRKKKRVKHEKV